MVVPIHHVRTHRVTRVKIANIERIILSHLASELLPDPVSYRRLALLVKPPEPLHLPYNPFLLALFGQNPAKSNIVGGLELPWLPRVCSYYMQMYASLAQPMSSYSI